MSASQTGSSLLLALIIGCASVACLGGRVGLFAEREGALAPLWREGVELKAQSCGVQIRANALGSDCPAARPRLA